MTHVIKMNIDGTIIGSMKMTEAISGIVTDKYTTVLTDDSGRVFHSQNLNIQAPIVVMTNKYDHISTVIRSMSRSGDYDDNPISRRAILFRDRHVCCYCGSNNGYTIDHIHPRSAGGNSSWRNLVACCTDCNSKKGNKSLAEVGFEKLYEVRKPEVYEIALSSASMSQWSKLYDAIDILKSEAIIV